MPLNGRLISKRTMPGRCDCRLDDGDRLTHTGPNLGPGARRTTIRRRRREPPRTVERRGRADCSRARAGPVAHDLGVDRVGRARLPRLPGVHRDRPRHHLPRRGAVLRHRADAAGRLPAAQAAHPAWPGDDDRHPRSASRCSPALIYAFVKPLVDQASNFSRDLPQYVEDARDGTGPIGDIVKRYDLEQKVKDNQDKIQQAVTDFGENGLDIVRRIFSTIVAALTVMVLTILILIEGPTLSQNALDLVPDDRREDAVRRVAVDACRAVSGYVFGNLLISVIAGIAAWLMLFILGVPYAEVLGLFVGFADLIPLVGATLGAIPTIAFAFLHSVPAGIVTIDLLHRVPAVREPRAAGDDHVAHGQAQPAGRARQRADRRRAVRLPRRAARHPRRAASSRSSPATCTTSSRGRLKTRTDRRCRRGADLDATPDRTELVIRSAADGDRDRRARGPHRRLAAAGQGARPDPRVRAPTTGSTSFDLGRTNVDPSRAAHRDHDGRRRRARRAARAAAGARRQPRRVRATPRSSRATSTACCPPASTRPPTSPPTCASTATGAPVENPEMDCGIVVRDDVACARCRCTACTPATASSSASTACGCMRPSEPRDVRNFEFMDSDVSSEKPKALLIEQVAERIRSAKARGGKLLAVCGPAVVHTGGAPGRRAARARRDGSTCCSRATASRPTTWSRTCSARRSACRSPRARRSSTATRNHLRVINEVRRHGSIAAAVEAGFVTGGVMYECVQRRRAVRARRLGPRRRAVARHDRRRRRRRRRACASSCPASRSR